MDIRPRLADTFEVTSFPIETGRTSLNYVWINKEKAKTKDGYVLCAVPLNYLDTAIDNARRYPNAKVNVWIDDRMLDASSKFFTDAYHYLAGPSNLHLRSLHDIPAYASDDFFQAERDTPIWSRVDYARILVAAHEMKTTDAKYVFYSDFDVRDARIQEEEITQILDRHGLVVGGTRELAIENGYFGFGRKAEKLLCEKLVPATRDNVHSDYVHCGYGAYTAEIDKWFANDPRYAEKISMMTLKSMGYKIPFNPDHDGLGLYSP